MKKPFKLTMETREKLEGLFFISPFIVGLLIFFAFPLYLSIKLSFGKVVNIVGFIIELRGIENYTRAFLLDINFVPTFIKVVKSTLIEAPLIIIMSLLIAVMINKKIKFRGFFRVVFFIPFLLGTGEVMKQLLSQGVDKQVLSIVDGTLIPYQVLNYFGGSVVDTVNNTFGMLVTVLWHSGVQILLFLSGLQSISEALFESAEVDGATQWEVFWKITFPMMAPTTFLCIIYTLVDSFTNIKNPILSYIQDFAFKQTQFEYAAAMGWIYFTFIILLILIINGVMGTYINALNDGGGKKIEAKKKDSSVIAVEVPNTYNGTYFKKLKHWASSSSRVKESLFKFCMYVLLFDLAFVFLFPFLYMVVTALKSNADLNDLTVNWIPKSLKWENFAIAFNLLSYGKYFKNSFVITVLATLGHAMSCSFIGYGFARYKFPFKNLLFFLVIISFIVPVQTIIVPLYLTYKNFGWLDTYLPLIVPAFFGFGLKGGLFIFLFRQYYMGLPKELEEAAKIDGCGFLSTYLRIVMPIAMSTFLVTVVLSVVWHWNDFYEPSIYVSKATMTVLPSRISYIVSLVNAPPEELFDSLALEEGEDVLNNAVVIAGTFLIIAPVLILFTFLQNKFIQGVESAGIKG